MARSAKQVAAQRKAAKASGLKRSRASSKSAPMMSHNAPGKIPTIRTNSAGLLHSKGATASATPAFFGKVTRTGSTAKRQGGSDIITKTRQGNKVRSVTRSEVFKGIGGRRKK